MINNSDNQLKVYMRKGISYLVKIFLMVIAQNSLVSGCVDREQWIA